MVSEERENSKMILSFARSGLPDTTERRASYYTGWTDAVSATPPPSNAVREAVEEIEKWSVVGKMTEQGMREALGYINNLSRKFLAALGEGGGR